MRIVTAASLVAALLAAPHARAMCRVVVENGTLPPIIEPQQAVLLVLERGVKLGPSCPAPSSDGGGSMASDDGGGSMASDDGGGSMTSDDGGGSMASDDGGALDDGGPLFTPPDAACPSRIGNAVTMVVQPTFSTRGDGARFALLMVTPDVPTVTLARASLFHDLAVVTAPNVVHQQKTVEDPTLGTQCGGGYYSDAGGCGGGFGGSYGGPVNPPVYQPPTPGAEDAGIPADVTTLGPYELAVLGGADLAAVEAWLTAHNYFFDSNDTAALAPYLALGWTVTAVRVSSKPAAMVPLTPIAFTFESDVLRLPVAVAHDPSGGTMPLTAYVAADGRYDFTGANVPYAEYSNTVTGAGFLTRNDLTIDLSAPIDLDPIGVRDYGNTEHQDSVTVIDEVHVPVSQCDPAPSARGSGCGCGCNVAGERALPFPLVAFVLFIALRLAWRRRS